MTEARSIVDAAGLAGVCSTLCVSAAIRCIGPTVRDEAIVYDEIATSTDLPRGCGDEQDGGHYRLDASRRRGAVRLCRRPAILEEVPASAGAAPVARAARGRRAARRGRAARRTRNSPSSACAPASCTPSPFRTTCFLGGEYVDPHYRARREDVFVVAVNCGVAGGACFCVSMDTGPKATIGFRPRADRDRRADGVRFSSRRDGGGQGAAGRHCRIAPRPPARSSEARGDRRADGGQHGPQPCEADDVRRAARAQSRSSALGRCRRALPLLHQLHDGLSDLLLHDASRTRAISPASRARARGAGIPASPGFFLYSRRQRAAAA